MIIGESDWAVNVISLSCPNWQFQIASFSPKTFNKGGTQTSQAAPRCLFIYLF